VRVEFTHTADDFAEANRPPERGPAARPRVSRLRLALRIVRGGDVGDWSRADLLQARGAVIMIAGLFLMIASTAYVGVRGTRAWLVPCAFASLFTAAVLWPVVRNATGWGARRTFASDPDNAGPAAVEVDDDAFRFIAAKWQCRVAWSAVRELVETPNLLLVIDDSPSTFIVPKRAFASDADREQFAAHVRAHVEPALAVS
jgi:hypothetical protein